MGNLLRFSYSKKKSPVDNRAKITMENQAGKINRSIPLVRPVNSITFRAARSVPATYGAAPDPASCRMVSRSSGKPKIVSKAMIKPGSRTEWTWLPAIVAPRVSLKPKVCSIGTSNWG